MSQQMSQQEAISQMLEVGRLVGVDIDMKAQNADAELNRVDSLVRDRVKMMPAGVQPTLIGRWEEAFDPIRAKVDEVIESRSTEAAEVAETAAVTAGGAAAAAAAVRSVANTATEFAAADTSGAITSIERNLGVGLNDLATLYHELDSNGDGALSAEEAAVLLKHPKIGAEADVVRSIIADSDRNDDGNLGVTEFLAAITAASAHVESRALEKEKAILDERKRSEAERSEEEAQAATEAEKEAQDEDSDGLDELEFQDGGIMEESEASGTHPTENDASDDGEEYSTLTGLPSIEPLLDELIAERITSRRISTAARHSGERYFVSAVANGPNEPAGPTAPAQAIGGARTRCDLGSGRSILLYRSSDQIDDDNAKGSSRTIECDAMILGWDLANDILLCLVD